MFLDYFALGIIFFVAITLFYGVIVIHDIPYEIAKHRDHPHQDAIHVAGWVSLFTLHVLWPFLWIWATLYRRDRGWGFNSTAPESAESNPEIASLTKLLADASEALEEDNRRLRTEIDLLKQRLDTVESQAQGG